VPAASVEQAALQAGYPVGPLAVTDEVTLTLGRRIREEARRAGAEIPTHPAEAIVDRMVDEFGRHGKSSGQGFYDYPADGSPKRLWSGLAEAFGAVVPPRVGLAEMQERMLFAEVLEDWHPGREHWLDLRHRLPGLDRWRVPVRRDLPGWPGRFRRSGAGTRRQARPPLHPAPPRSHSSGPLMPRSTPWQGRVPEK
jgi:hypothetical protein